ncbi:hypothetical protein DPMN_080466 [Dreissena polymorpha]|uniref:Uncharacterized protein n=1 Tax=Dreissena polymorpha TaxID=45954 RepID=A0A9D3YV36_DREPO|nr:hypothetical protein DPMN_080466 [Dreissena polymorpha]
MNTVDGNIAAGIDERNAAWMDVSPAAWIDGNIAAGIDKKNAAWMVVRLNE